MWIGTYVEQFRSDETLRWLYKIGKYIQHFTFFLCPLAGIINGIWIITKSKMKWKWDALGVLVSLFPTLYFITMMTVAMTKKVG